MAEVAVRFGISDGRLRASTWKCWSGLGTGKSDFYLACRELGMTQKISFHQSGDWQYAYIQRYLDEHSDPADIGDRIVKRWRRPDMAPGATVTVAFRLLVLPSAVSTPIGQRAAAVQWIPAPSDDSAVLLAICVTTPQDPAHSIDGWVGSNTGTHLVGSFPLVNGERVWVVYQQIARPRLPPPRPAAHTGFFKGKTAADLHGPNVRALAFTAFPDGVWGLVEGTPTVTPCPSDLP